MDFIKRVTTWVKVAAYAAMFAAYTAMLIFWLIRVAMLT